MGVNMSNNLYDQAIAEAKQLREMAEQNAKNKIIEAVTPRIKALIEAQILGEQEPTGSNGGGGKTEGKTNFQGAMEQRAEGKMKQNGTKMGSKKTHPFPPTWAHLLKRFGRWEKIQRFFSFFE